MKHHKSNIIHPTATIHDNVKLGENNTIGPYVVLGGVGECRGETKRKGMVIIGDNNVINSAVTIDGPVRTDLTKIGSNCFIMTKSHIAHDCFIHNNVTIAPGSIIGGVCVIDDYVSLGINSSIHQRLHIGESAMIGMGAVITKHILPFSVMTGSPAKILKCNVIGAKKRGLDFSLFKENPNIYFDMVAGKIKDQSMLSQLLQNFKNKHTEAIALI